MDYNYPTDTLTSPVLSTYYSQWETESAEAWQNITYNMGVINETYNNGIAPVMETVIRTNDNITYFDLVQRWNWTVNTTNTKIKPVNYSNFHDLYQQTPLKYGFYCIYENVEDEYIVPDCQNISEVTEYHANLLTSAGIDFIVLDLTNGNTTKDADIINGWIKQIRPTQVLYEKWNELNIKYGNDTTPKICAWNPANGEQYQYYLDLYNKYPNMPYKYNNKLVYFVNINGGYPLNQTVYNLIESNGGRNNIGIQSMWTAQNESQYQGGLWTYIGFVIYTFF